MPGPHANWQSLGAGGLYGGQTVTSGGGGSYSRSEIDGLRMGVGRTPEADYPDGYLGTVRSRRDDRGRPSSTSDRVLTALQGRLTQRSYQRGVHKGVLVDPSDYFWPPALDPTRGLANQARGIRTAPLLAAAPAPRLVDDGKADLRATGPAPLDPVRQAAASRVRPPWR